jgi:predicted RNase H-like nuclease (RuvC/YqgF family)
MLSEETIALMSRIGKETDTLVARAMLAWGVTDPDELVLCHEVTPSGARIWVEPMSPKVREGRVAMLNEENKALRARIRELEEDVEDLRGDHAIACANAERAEREAERACKHEDHLEARVEELEERIEELRWDILNLRERHNGA